MLLARASLRVGAVLLLTTLGGISAGLADKAGAYLIRRDNYCDGTRPLRLGYALSAAAPCSGNGAAGGAGHGDDSRC